jgi:hypothetical protein
VPAGARTRKKELNMRNPLALAAALLGLAGCVITPGTNPPPKTGGDITFKWTFGANRLTCAQAGVSQVHITLNGPAGAEALENNGYYPCTVSGVDGITLKNFAAGNYGFTIDGYTFGNVLSYAATGTIELVNGSMTVQPNLALVATIGTANIYWDFGTQQKSCANAGITIPPGGNTRPGITSVEISIDGGDFVPWNCSVMSGGTAVQGVQVQLNAGTHTVDLYGAMVVGGQKQYWYSVGMTIDVAVATTKNFSVSLDPIAAGATFIPAAVNCSMSPYIAVTLKHGTEPEQPTVIAACADTAAYGLYWSYLRADDNWDDVNGVWKGVWQVTMEAWSNSDPTTHNVIKSGQANIELTAGLENQTGTVTLNF